MRYIIRIIAIIAVTAAVPGIARGAIILWLEEPFLAVAITATAIFGIVEMISRLWKVSKYI